MEASIYDVVYTEWGRDCESSILYIRTTKCGKEGGMQMHKKCRRLFGRRLWDVTHVCRLEDVEPLLESRVAAEVHVEPRVHEGAAEHGHRAQARRRAEYLRKSNLSKLDFVLKQ